MNKALIFVTGVVVGVVAGTVTTVLCYDHQRKKREAEETSSEPVVANEEEMRRYYIQGLRDLGINVWDVDEDGDYVDNFEEEPQQSVVNPVDEDEEQEEGSEEESDTYPVDPNPDPYEISSREHGTKEFYDTETLQYFKGDGQITDANYEFVDDWQQHVGYIEDRLKSETADSIYIRNEVEQTDYEILIYNDSYTHAVEGEPLGDMAD